MLKRNYWPIVGALCLCLSFWFSACSEQSTPVTSMSGAATATTANNISKVNQSPFLRWLQGIPCRLPCYEGITPGRTTLSEALELFKKNPFIANPRVFKLSSSGSLYWDWSLTPGFNGGTAYFDENAKDPIIYEISPNFTEELKLSNLIEAYGEPSHVFAQSITIGKPRGTLHAGVNFFAVFIYLPLGMEVEAYFPYRTDFNQNLVLSAPRFFAPTEVDPSKNEVFRKMIAWEGFNKGFDFYNFNCRPTAVCNYTSP